jgi:hypothetical protein
MLMLMLMLVTMAFCFCPLEDAVDITRSSFFRTPQWNASSR